MKLNREELELRVLKHLISYPKAIMRAQRIRITDAHFRFLDEETLNSFSDEDFKKYAKKLFKKGSINEVNITEIEEAKCSKASMTRLIFKFLMDYFDKSDGYLVNQLVFENKIIESNMDMEKRAKYMSLWADIESQDYDENELHDLLMLLKKYQAQMLFNNHIRRSEEIILTKGISQWCTEASESIEKVRNEIEEFAAEPHSVDLSNSSEYFEREYIKRRDDPQKYDGIMSGIANLDEPIMGLRRGEVGVILAGSGSGKSIFMLNWMHNAFKQGKNVLYFSFEMDEWKTLLRHISLGLQIPFKELKRNIGNNDTVADIKRRINVEFEQGDNFFHYDCQMEDPSPEYVEAKIREMDAAGKMPDIICADYIGNMSPRNAVKGSQPWQNNGDSFEALFKISRRWKIPILTAQQINKLITRENRQMKQKNKAASYETDAGAGDSRITHLSMFQVALNADREHNITTVHCVKSRDEWFQPFGVAVDKDFNQMRALTPEQQILWKDLNGITNDSKDNSQSPEQLEITTSNTIVDFHGKNLEYTEDDMLVIDTIDWDA